MGVKLIINGADFSENGMQDLSIPHNIREGYYARDDSGRFKPNGELNHNSQMVANWKATNIIDSVGGTTVRHNLGATVRVVFFYASGTLFGGGGVLSSSTFTIPAGASKFAMNIKMADANPAIADVAVISQDKVDNLLLERVL